LLVRDIGKRTPPRRFPCFPGDRVMNRVVLNKPKRRTKTMLQSTTNTISPASLGRRQAVEGESRWRSSYPGTGQSRREVISQRLVKIWNSFRRGPVRRSEADEEIHRPQNAVPGSGQPSNA
jgi:hypothetical protein